MTALHLPQSRVTLEPLISAVVCVEARLYCDTHLYIHACRQAGHSRCAPGPRWLLGRLGMTPSGRKLRAKTIAARRASAPPQQCSRLKSRPAAPLLPLTGTLAASLVISAVDCLLTIPVACSASADLPAAKTSLVPNRVRQLAQPRPSPP